MNIVAITFAISLLFPCLVSAHGGGLDAQGGHRDRKANNYHFHQGPLEGKTYTSKDAATAALSALELAEESDEGLADFLEPLTLPLFDLAPYRPYVLGQTPRSSSIRRTRSNTASPMSKRPGSCTVSPSPMSKRLLSGSSPRRRRRIRRTLCADFRLLS